MKKIINILLSFFMAIVIFGTGVCFTGAVITSKPFVKAAVNISGYSKNVETEIADDLKSVAIPSGLPENFFDDKIKTDFINKVIDECIDAALSKKEYEMPLEEIETLIYNDIIKYAKDNGTELDKEATDMLKNTAELAAVPYKNFTHNIFYRALKHLGGLSVKLFIATLILLAVLVFMTYLLKGHAELTYGLCGGGLMLILPLIFIINGKAFKWGIMSLALLKFLNTFIGLALLLVILCGVIALTIGIIKIIRFYKKQKSIL